MIKGRMIVSRFAITACVIGMVVGIAPSAGASPPQSSRGCNAQLRLPAGDYTEANWPIRQTSTNGQVIGRIFNVHVPKLHEQQQGPPLAVVINLHGAASTGPVQDRNSRMRELSDSEGFVVATPDARPWDAWAVSHNGISDIEFVRMLLDTLTGKLCIDRNRIYATGLSAGGLMSTYLARASAEGRLGVHKIAAIAPVAALPVPPDSDQTSNELTFSIYIRPSVEAFDKLKTLADSGLPTRHSEPVPMHVFYGKEDRLIANGLCYGTYLPLKPPLDPDTKKRARKFLCYCYDAEPNSQKVCPSQPPFPGVHGNVASLIFAARYTVNLWAVSNGCLININDPQPTGHSGWGVPIERLTFDCSAVANSRGDTILSLYDATEQKGHINNVEEPGGHFWPGAPGQGNFELTREIWTFFKNHPR